MKRAIRSNERDRLRVIMNLVRQSRDFNAYNSVILIKELKRDIIKPRSVA